MKWKCYCSVVSKSDVGGCHMREGGGNEIVGGGRVVCCHPYEVQSIGDEAGSSELERFLVGQGCWNRENPNGCCFQASANPPLKGKLHEFRKIGKRQKRPQPWYW